MKTTVNIPLSLQNQIADKAYENLYREFVGAMDDGQFLSKCLKGLFPASFRDRPFDFELMLSLRAGPQDEDQEGIWHDDSSRDLIFSLSLTESFETIEGGELSLRKLDQKDQIIQISTQSFGTLLFFPSGNGGWEHKISRVKAGNRLVLVGWLTFR
ncbi:MAG: 2OG-Fe(II) oxygenase [Halobacteriovoraceae bacterium]|nr:2OG-Fe(II) oxygenase [Halobacteriovoraceae bacterium]